MNRCLRERALFGIFAGEGTAAQHAHLRLCADCAEHYDQLIDDMHALGEVLAQPPPRPRLARHAPAAWLHWAPVAAAAAVLLVVGLAVRQRSSPPPVQVAAPAAGFPVFAADVSAALFASGDDSATTQNPLDAPYLEAALEAGLPCTRERFFDGECEDQVFALVLQSD